jgi:hypothetical protein
MIALTDLLLFQIRVLKLPEPIQEFRFHPVRKWRFDFCWPDDSMLAVEVEGGTFSGGRHTRGRGYENDAIKYDEAMRLGWKVYRCTGDMVRSGRAVETIGKLLDL